GYTCPLAGATGVNSKRDASIVIPQRKFLRRFQACLTPAVVANYHRPYAEFPYCLTQAQLVRLSTYVFQREPNARFGVYKTLCCDVEMVIDKGHVFPDCPKHTRLTTAWKAINDTDKNMPRAVELKVNPSKSADKEAA